MKFGIILFLSVSVNYALSLSIPPTLYPSHNEDDYPTDNLLRNFDETNYLRKSMEGLNDDNNSPAETVGLRHFKNREPLLSFGKRRYVPSTYRDAKRFFSPQKKNGEELDKINPLLLRLYLYGSLPYEKRNDEDFRQFFRNRLWKKVKSEIAFKG